VTARDNTLDCVCCCTLFSRVRRVDRLDAVELYVASDVSWARDTHRKVW